MSGADVGGGGGAGGTVVTTVLANMHLGGLFRRLTGQAVPRIGQQRRQVIRSIPGASVVHGQYRLPALNVPKGPFRTGLTTNANAEVLRWLKQYKRFGLAAPGPAETVATNVPATSPPFLPVPGADYGTPGQLWQLPQGSLFDQMTRPRKRKKKKKARRFGDPSDWQPDVPANWAFGPGFHLPTFPGINELPPLTVPGFISPVLTTVGGLLAAILLGWPSSTSSTDVIYGLPAPAVPRPTATPGGRTRGRRRTLPPLTRPSAVPRPRSTPKILGRTIVKAPPRVAEHTTPAPSAPPPIAAPSIPKPTSSTSSIPFPAPPAPIVTAPGPWSTFYEFVKPIGQAYLGQYLGSLGQRRPGVGQIELPSQAPVAQPGLAPLTALNTSALPYAATNVDAHNCSCAKARKRGKKSCSNPVTRKTKSTRGGHRYITTTRRIQCPA